MRRFGGRVAGGCAVAVVVLASGCGGGGPLTKAEYRHEASHVCRRSNMRVQRITVAKLEDGGAAARGIGRVVAVQRGTLSYLRAIKPPKEDAAVIEKWLAVIDQLIDETDAVRVALDAHDQARALATAKLVLLLDGRAKVLATAYGIRPCRLHARSVGI